MLQIPVTNNPKTEFFTQVYDTRTSDNANAVNLQLTTYFNTMSSMWYLDLKDSLGNPYALGLAMVPNIDITRSVTILPNDFGQFRIFDTTGDGNATLTSLGNSSYLVYFANGEFEDLYTNSPSVTKIAPIGDM